MLAFFAPIETNRALARVAEPPKLSDMNDTTEHKSPWIIDTDDETFDADVFERSQQTPVVVDFWAAWCAPCRMLGPILEELAEEYQGRFILAKADTDRAPKAAAQFNVQSIPAVYAVSGGEEVDFFVGVLPKEQLRDWIDRLLLLGVAVEAERLEETDPESAETRYRTLIEQAPNDPRGPIGLAGVLLAQNRADEATQLIEQLEERGFLEPEAEKVKAELQLRDTSGDDLATIRAEAVQHSDDLSLQLKLAEALAGQKQYEQALDKCLEIVAKDKKGVGEEARQVMVNIFRVLPDDSEMVRNYRRKLSTLLY